MTFVRSSLRVLAGAAFMALACVPNLAQAQAQAPAQPQAYPARPVRLVVNFPAGGPVDLLARMMADALQSSFKQTFIVDNKPGAGGNIGAEQVAKSPADGLTLLVSIDTTLTVNPHIYKSIPFKVEDFRPVMVMASSGMMIGASPSTGFKTLGDLVAAGKVRKLNFGSGGNGSPGHLGLEVLADATGIKGQHVPYKGNNPAVTAILANEVDAGVLATPGLLPHVRAGKINALAVTSRRPSKLAPEVPTTAAAGFKGLEQEVFYVVMVPRATPDSVVQALYTAMDQAFKRPDTQARLNALDLFYEGLGGQDAGKRLAELSARYARIAKATGMQPE